MNITVLSDKKDLVPVGQYPYASYPFEYFNPVQSRVFDLYDKDDNCLVASSTASGKTTVAEMFIAQDVRKNGRKGVYLAPLRSLAQEKYDDWTDKSHHFSDLKICICTGDYRLTPERKREIEESNLIIMTSETLNSRARNFKSENNQFLKDIGTLVIDECFPGKTLVKVDNKNIAIVDVVNDDKITHVSSYDDGKIVKKKIIRKITRDGKELVSIKHTFGLLTCTADHKIWTERGYVRAGDLSEGDVVKYIDCASKVEHVTPAGKCDKVYDLEIEDTHNYFAEGVLVSNCHLLTVQGRGDHLESGVIKFTEVNPDSRFVLLSATMPNVEEIASWVSNLTDRMTNVIRSDYRPCPLNIHFPQYRSSQNYTDSETNKISRAMDIIDKYQADKFLIFVHSKRTGEQMLRKLEHRKIKCAYHNADLPKEKRIDIENKFRNDPSLRIVVSTSSLAWGCNLPARRVIILGVHRGKTDVENYDIWQECGRAGRPKYDPCGDAYILVPDMQFLKYKEKIMTPTPVISCLTGANTLAFHVVSEVHHRTIKTMSDLDDWYKRTFAFHQRSYAGMADCHEALSKLENAGCIKISGENIDVTGVGAVASMFYYCPFDMSNLYKNFKKLFQNGTQDSYEYVAFALSCVPSNKIEMPTVAELDDLQEFYGEARFREAHEFFNKNASLNGEVKNAYCYYWLFYDEPGYGTSLSTLSRSLRGDFERLGDALKVLDQMAGRWGKDKFFDALNARIIYGVNPELVDFVRIKGIGRVKAQKLYDGGIKKLKDMNAESVALALKCSKTAAEKICQEASALPSR